MKSPQLIEAEEELARYLRRIEQFLFDVQPALVWGKQDERLLFEARALSRTLQDQRKHILTLWRS